MKGAALYNRLSRLTMAPDDEIARLARKIDAVKKAERFLANADEVANLRRHGASELHRICSEFVSSVNSSLAEATLDLSPATYAPEMFREPGVNLIQISSQGREMQIAFEDRVEIERVITGTPEPFAAGFQRFAFYIRGGRDDSSCIARTKSTRF